MKNTTSRKPNIADILVYIGNNNIEGIKSIIPQYCPPHITNGGASLFISALSYNSSIEMFKALIQIGTPVNLPYNNRYPIDIAIHQRRPDVAYEFIKAGSSYVHKITEKHYFLDYARKFYPGAYSTIAAAIRDKAYQDALEQGINFTRPMVNNQTDHQALFEAAEQAGEFGLLERNTALAIEQVKAQVARHIPVSLTGNATTGQIMAPIVDTLRTTIAAAPNNLMPPEQGEVETASLLGQHHNPSELRKRAKFGKA